MAAINSTTRVCMPSPIQAPRLVEVAQGHEFEPLGVADLGPVNFREETFSVPGWRA
jgi:hypothetical protein